MGLVPPADQGDGAPELALTWPVGGQRGSDPGLVSPGTFHHIPPSLAGESLQTCRGRGWGWGGDDHVVHAQTRWDRGFEPPALGPCAPTGR